ncbi:hypothetical protein ACVIWV_010288 [Bradyrhizobium diazoefficiens]
MVEEMLAARGIGVTYETVRQWGRKFGKPFSDRIRQRAPAPDDKWHLDEVVISIAGEQHWLWRAVDQNGFVLDVLIDSGTTTPPRLGGRDERDSRVDLTTRGTLVPCIKTDIKTGMMPPPISGSR